MWNNFILPLVLTQSNSVAVLPLGLTKLEGQYAINVSAVMAAVLLSVLPLVVLFVVMRKQVMRVLETREPHRRILAPSGRPGRSPQPRTPRPSSALPRHSLAS